MFVQWMISTKLPSMHLVGEVWAGAVGGLSGGLGPVLRSEKYADPTHTACLVCLLCTVYCLRSVDIVELVKKTLRVEIYIYAVMNEGHEVAIARKAQSPGKLDDWSRGTSRRARTTS
jgi:Fe-S oxidoreductase